MQTEYTLSPEEQAEVQNYLQPLGPTQGTLNAALRLLIRQQKLTGNWELDAEGINLVRKEPPAVYQLSLPERNEVLGYLQTIGPIQNLLNGILRLIARQQNLEGEWGLSSDATKLLRKE